MKRFHGASLCLALLGASAGAAPRTPPAAPAPLRSEVTILRISPSAYLDSNRSRFAGRGDPRWSGWITADDMPAEARGQPFIAETFVTVEVDSSGKPLTCAPTVAGPEPQLEALACRLLVRRATFDPRYEAPGKAVAATWELGIRWETRGGPPPVIAPTNRAPSLAPPVPPAPTASRLPPQRTEIVPHAPILLPPSSPPPPQPTNLPIFTGWPRLAWRDNLVFGPPPDVQAAYPAPAQGPKEGSVSLDLVVSPALGVTECRVGVGSGSAALDEAACRVARTVEMRYSQPCDGCGISLVPIKVVWRKRGSELRLPRPAGDSAYVAHRQPLPLELAKGDYAKLPGLTAGHNRFGARLNVAEDGKPLTCEITRSSGNADIDTRTCQLLLKRQRYTLRTDVFGDPAPDVMPVTVDLRGLWQN
ncbi:MAG TPA: energy transducer TonB [Allosphingosinicella sp.]|nr:energy transducer TonB [Allosphingosinicella sp.]